MKILLLFFLTSMSYSQAVYKSLASEYYYLNYEGQSKIEWMEREIIFNEENIVIKSFGDKATDMQIWKIFNHTKLTCEDKTVQIFDTFLRSGEDYEYPATFSIIIPANGDVDIITCEIPASSHNKLAEGAPVTVSFYID